MINYFLINFRFLLKILVSKFTCFLTIKGNKLNIDDDDDDQDEIDDNLADLNNKDISHKQDQSRVLDENLKLLHRSKSMPPSTILLKKNNNLSTNNSSLKMNKTNDVNTDRLKMAKEEAERAIKVYIL